MATKEQIEQWRQAGEKVARARKDRDDHGDRPPEEVKRLREAAAETAAGCADCFMPLASTTSVTLTIRWTHHTPMRYNPIGMRVPARDHRRDHMAGAESGGDRADRPWARAHVCRRSGTVHVQAEPAR